MFGNFITSGFQTLIRYIIGIFQSSIQRVWFNFDEFNYFIGKYLYTSYRGFGERVDTFFSPRIWRHAGGPTMDHWTETISLIVNYYSRRTVARYPWINRREFFQKMNLTNQLTKTEWYLKRFFSVKFNNFSIIEKLSMKQIRCLQQFSNKKFWKYRIWSFGFIVLKWSVTTLLGLLQW